MLKSWILIWAIFIHIKVKLFTNLYVSFDIDWKMCLINRKTILFCVIFDFEIKANYFYCCKIVIRYVHCKPTSDKEIYTLFKISHYKSLIAVELLAIHEKTPLWIYWIRHTQDWRCDVIMKNGLIYFLSCMAIEKVIAFGVILNFELKVNCCYCCDRYWVYVKHNFLCYQPSKIICFLYSLDGVAQCYVSKINGNGSRNLQRQMQEKVNVKSTNR